MKKEKKTTPNKAVAHFSTPDARTTIILKESVMDEGKGEFYSSV